MTVTLWFFNKKKKKFQPKISIKAKDLQLTIGETKVDLQFALDRFVFSDDKKNIHRCKVKFRNSKALKSKTAQKVKMKLDVQKLSDS